MSTTVQHRPLMTHEEVAGVLRISKRTAWRLASARDLPSVRVGAQIRVDPLELEQWLRRPPGAESSRVLDAERG